MSGETLKGRQPNYTVVEEVSGGVIDLQVVPFYASTIRVSAAPEDCINPDLQLQDPQIVHYLRAKALLRARARVFREQMYEAHHPPIRETEASGTDLSAGGSRTSDGKNQNLRHSPRHRPLPSVCPLHGRTNSSSSGYKRGVEESSSGGHSPQGGNSSTRGGTIRPRKPGLSSAKYISPAAGMGNHEKTSNSVDSCTPSSSSRGVPLTSAMSLSSSPAGGASWSLVSGGGTKTPSASSSSSSAVLSKPGAAAFPAAAAMAAKRGACAFDSIYACPICSPLGEVCPPSSLGYYYHDPLLPTFGTGVITTSAALADPENVASVAAMTAKKEKKPGKPSTNKGPSSTPGGGGEPVDPMGAMTAAAATSGAVKTAAEGASTGDISSAQGDSSSNRVVGEKEDEKGQKEPKVPSSADTTAAAVSGATAAVTGTPDSNPKLGKEALLRRSTVRQRRRVRECHSSGGLCMKAGCGCSTLPPLLRLCCSTQELLQIALEASPDATLRELFDVGRADAYR